MKILIKLPSDLEQVMDCFPFLHLLNKNISNTQGSLHLISNFEGIELLNLLPFKAFYYDFSKDNLKGILNTFRSYKLSVLKKENFDYFINLGDTKEGNILGFLSRTSKRIGFSDSSYSFLLNVVKNKLQGRAFYEQVVELLTELDFEQVKIENYGSRELDMGVENPYLLIDESLLEDNEWEDFLKLFNPRFIKVLGSSSSYESIKKENYISIGKVIYNSSTFISNNKVLVNLASYTGVKSFYIHKKERIDLLVGHSFLGKIYSVNVSASEYKDSESIHYGKLFDYLYENVDLGLKGKNDI